MAKKYNLLAHKVLYKISYRIYAKIQKKGNLCRIDIRDILKRLCGYKGIEIVVGHMMIDHVHLLL